jgi:ABC-type multidrug transport system fused ATPase/permease subunit
MAVSATARVANQGLGVLIPALGIALVVSGWPLGQLLALLVGLAVIKGGCRYLEQFTGHAVAFRLLAELRVDLYRRIVPLAPAGLEDERTGDLVARLVGDVDRVEPFYAHTIAPLVSGIVVPLLAAVGLGLWIDPLLALTFAPFPLLIALGVPWLRVRHVARLSALTRDQAGEVAASLTDAIQGAREVAVLEARDNIVDAIEHRATAAATSRRSLSRVSAARSVLGELLAGGAVVAVTAVGITRLDAGMIGLAGLAAAITLAWVGTGPARAVEEIVPDLEQALAAAGRLFDISDREPPVTWVEESGPAPANGSIGLAVVSVRLRPSGQPTLEDIELEVDHGGYLAVVGPSGSGKSTLVELLLRFRDPEGKVEIGGINLRDLKPSQVSSAVALVPQRPDIFYGTLADNLRLAQPGVGHEEMWEALDAVALGAWARGLEHGLDTKVGELGGTLSGGQRQRIALARSLLRDPLVLILDEATSELDTETEAEVLSSMARDRGRRTLVVVAHRLETVVDADEIVVLDRGRLVERGRHADLRAAGGVYAGLWNRHLDLLDIGS